MLCVYTFPLMSEVKKSLVNSSVDVTLHFDFSTRVGPSYDKVSSFLSYPAVSASLEFLSQLLSSYFISISI
jgi:hypothetical protein